MITDADWARILCCIRKIIAEGGGGVPSPSGCGDLLVGAGSEWIVLPGGTNGQVPVYNDAVEGCIEWTTLPGGGDMLAANNLSDLTDKPLALINLGGTTVGINIFKVPNPGAITFLRVNADNTVSLLSAAAFRTAIGAGTGNGTVTSVGLSMPTGFSVAGTPVTTSGSFAVTTALNGPVRGTGTGFTTGATALGSETTGDYVEDLTGTANQIDVTGGTGAGSNPVVSLSPVIDISTHTLVLPYNVSVPGSGGEISVQDTVWGAGSGTILFSANATIYRVINVNDADTPGNGESPVFNSGTGFWEYGSPSATPAGADKQIQINNAGAFGAEAGFEYDLASNTFTVANSLHTGWTVEGHTAQLTTFAGVTTPRHQIHGTSTTLSSGSQSKWAADATGPYFILTSSRGASAETYTVVQNGDSLGKISFQGADGTDFAIGAEVEARVSGTPGGNDMPSSLFFRTTPDGSATVADRWVIDHTGLFFPAADATHDIGAASFRPRDIYLSRNVIFPDGVRQTFNPDNTNAGLNVGANASDPSAPTNGDLYYDSGNNLLRARINSAWVSLGAGGSGAPSTATYITQTADAGLSNEQAIGALASGILRGATTTGVITSLGDVLPVANGGTGQSTIQAAIDALMAASGALSQGDVFYYNGTNVVRLPAGIVGQALRTGGPGANPLWGQLINVLAADFTTTSTSLADVTGMTIPVGAGETWNIYFAGFYTSSATTEGALFSLNGPTASTIDFSFEWRTGATGLNNSFTTSYDGGTVSTAGPGAAATWSWRGTARVVTTASGTLALRFKTENGGAASATIKGGAVMIAYKT